MRSNLLAEMGQGAMTEALRVEPSPEKRKVQNAHDSKVRATASWVDGHISTKDHDAIHKRADSVIKKKGRK